MTKLGPYDVHELADTFPMIEGVRFDELVADVRHHGLRDEITLSHDQSTIIDGRNRYRACIESGTDPRFTALGEHYTEQMILDLIMSRNAQRRDLTVGQRATAGEAYERLVREDVARREGQRKSKFPNQTQETNEVATAAHVRQGRSASAAEAARAAGVSTRAMEQVGTVRTRAPELLPEVQAGTRSLRSAYEEARQRPKPAPASEPEKPRPAPVMLQLRTHKGDVVEYPKPAGNAKFNETDGDGISWAAWSWNPVTGCLHGCEYCYARGIAHRFTNAYPVGFTPLFHSERLSAPSNTVIPNEHMGDPAYQRVFVCSMADLYGRWVPDEWIAQVHAAMIAEPKWDYLTLTKFPDRYVGLGMPASAWVGTSVDEQSRVRIAERAFRQIEGVKVKWLSLEPLREPLVFEDLSMFDRIVIGAQTETVQPDRGLVPAFAPEFDWVARLYVQAADQGVQVHIKPNIREGKPGMRWPDWSDI